jgi:hypothetical protein
MKWRPHLFSLRTARQRLSCDLEQGTLALFDVERDPLEEHDLAVSEPELLGELRARLEEHLRAAAAAKPLEPGEVELSRNLAERLRKLGYY